LRGRKRSDREEERSVTGKRSVTIGTAEANEIKESVTDYVENHIR